MSTLNSRIFVLFLFSVLTVLILSGCGSQQPQEPAAGAPAGAESAAPPVAEPAPASTPAQSAKTAPKAVAPRSASEAKPAAAPASQPVVLSAGSELKVRTTTALSTKTNQAGQTFEATLEAPVMAGGRQVLPKGALVSGVITNADDGGRVSGKAVISLELVGVRAGGQTVRIATDIYTKEAQATKKKDAAKVGIGAGIGAIVGAIAGGGKGAAIGAAAGGGAGTAAVLATRGDAAEVPSESVLTFTLTKPVQIP